MHSISTSPKPSRTVVLSLLEFLTTYDGLTMKTLVVEGNLERLSGGVWNGTFYVHEFVDIGGKRLSKVAWTQFMAGFLQESMGKKVRISFIVNAGAHCVAAIEYDGKIEKEPSNIIAKAASPLAIAVFYFCVCAGTFVLAVPVGFAAGSFLSFIFAWCVLAAGFAILLPMRRATSAHRTACNALG